MRRIARRVLAALFCLALPATATEYPDHPVRMIVPFTPAGATDLLARIVGERLGEKLGQPVVIDNRPGAGANLGAGLAARARPDGYTLLMGPASVYAISATLYSKLDYDLINDLVPVSLVANVPHVLLVNVDLAVKSVPELIQMAKKQPDVPTVDESGLKGYSAHSWLGIFVPAGTPKPIVERLQRDLTASIDEPKSRARLMEAGFEPRSSTPAAFAKLVREEIEKWRPIVKMSGATPD